MDTFVSKHWFKLVTVVVLLAIVGGIAYQTLGKEKSPYKVENSDPAPDFTLQDADGKQVSFSESDGKVRLVYFYFSYCPDVCPPTTHFLSTVQDALKEKGVFGSKTMLYSLTFDPVRDTRERIEQFADQFHADPSGWKFLRDDSEQAMKQLAEKYGLLVEKDNKGNFIHTNAIFLVDKENRIRNYYSVDTDLTTQKVVNDMLVLSKE
ncbi:hypothetical protein J31TS4_40340 [Paenibacillus sp. J31TS4]|uniref:SCO family protein n=1 Tax=Paenibacillus sp. J31TS4 TaxID=2807195 RepID=UPI001B02EFE7|nr:SCO family protein [Paenibacillus sp. J31TS4]GIP40754.1 hypothetical protein J31TS4_40340 [Paenibacillus sp. J31TS4]